ncbi:F-actin capping protein alpha subunit [Catenaria anguillulae PL171]|uniref:F-actin-capping protein subunit alpha n=1 Tax=Catenaria anguillulae PL171 TaxID=765915 RepID=A0A1Y2HKA0_9FUNG|nr:F-actin capping protein alpha subunit [Catenaria anguillulae PL171]
MNSPSGSPTAVAAAPGASSAPGSPNSPAAASVHSASAGVAALAVSSPEIDIANDFIAQAPPGELENVLADLRVLHGNVDALNAGVVSGIEKYNLDQFAVVNVTWGEHTPILCEPAKLDNGRFIDPRANKSFAVDHATLAISDSADEEPSPQEAVRADLQTHLDSYIQSHYPRGVGLVYVATADAGFHIVIVDSKYKSDNFWNGRWRSHWTWANGKLTGTLRATVHYFENGNVQLAFNNDISLDLAADSKPDAVIKAIRKAENDRHKSLNDAYQEMSDNAFRNLRRALPLTKAKVDWNKLANYKVAAELAGK